MDVKLIAQFERGYLHEIDYFFKKMYPRYFIFDVPLLI